MQQCQAISADAEHTHAFAPPLNTLQNKEPEMSQGLIQALAHNHKVPDDARRNFLKLTATVSLTAAGGMLLGFSIPASSGNKPAKTGASSSGKGVFAPNAFIEI